MKKQSDLQKRLEIKFHLYIFIFLSDDEDAYESEDLKGMLEELVIKEEEEQTNTVGSLDNIQWNEFTSE